MNKNEHEETFISEYNDLVSQCLNWCDECVENIPELTTVKNIRFNLDARRTEINKKYVRAIMNQSDNEMNEVLDIIRTAINEMPGMMEKLRKAAEKVNPEIIWIDNE